MTSTYTKEEYAIAYTEVLGMIKYFSSESLEKIPNDVLKMFEDNKDLNYEFEFDRNESFDNQNISKLAKIIIADLFIDYIATEEERKYINYRDKIELDRIEEEKRNKYNPDEIFLSKNRNNKNEKEDNLNAKNLENISTDITTISENGSFIKKIFIKIKRLFK